MIAAAKRNYSGNNSSNKAKGKLHCNHCNGNNHTIDRCFHLHGFPPGHKYHKKNEQEGGKKGSYANNSQFETPSFTHEQYQQLLALLNNGNTQPKANVTGLGNEEDDWFREAA
ncbi:hypothetical protein LWI28_013352 [Acer negundo]|uniref:Uncharacterized protein n=1 Tax=Acer negundo TaxID=4023 RepID=A0AAD5P631_ACENE|nr:hypothetical protein LWI28_013352 [Acer negundo]